MSFSLGHVVMLLLVIALVVPALIQVWWRSEPPVLRSQHAPQHAAAVGRAPGRSSSSPLPGGLKADHPVLFLSRHILGHSARDARSSLRISREHLSRRRRGCPSLTDPVRDSG